MTNAVDIIGLEAIRALREAGFVVVHQEPSDDMMEAGYSAIPYNEGSLVKAWHRMVANSINAQNAVSKEGH